MSIAIAAGIALVLIAIIAIPIIISVVGAPDRATRTGPKTRKIGHAKSARAGSRTAR